MDTIYGMDPHLYNGRIYAFNLPGQTLGHPFLHREKFSAGTALIGNREYEGIMLNYDVHNQELVLQYRDLLGATQYISLSRAHLKGFRLGGDRFVFDRAGNNGNTFMQIIGGDHLQIRYHWTKKLSVASITGSSNHVFSEPSKTMYLIRESKLQRYRNNRSFLALFGENHRPKIKDYLKSMQIRVQKASDEQMALLLQWMDQSMK